MNEHRPFDLLRRFFAVIAQPRTWGSVAYVWLAFPLGIFYFVTLVTGSALSVGLFLLWIGLLLMVVLILSIRGLAFFERMQAKWLLGEELPLLLPKHDALTAWQSFKALLKDPATWKGALFLFLKFPLGIASWVISVVTFTLSAAFLFAPFDDYSASIDFWLWSFDDPTGGWLFSAFGVVLFFATLHVHDWMGRGWAALSKYLLGVSATDASGVGPVEPPAISIDSQLVPA
jgi:hypothetical protein